MFDANDRSNYSGGPLPRRYEELVLPKDWHIPGKLTRRRRAHRKSHGAIRFHEMNDKISTAWKAADDGVRRFCVDLSASEAARFNMGTKPTRSKGSGRRGRANDRQAEPIRLPEEHVTSDTASASLAERESRETRETLVTRRECVVTPELQPKSASSSTAVRIRTPSSLEAISSGSSSSCARRNSVASAISCNDPFFADLESDAIFMSLFETTVGGQASSFSSSHLPAVQQLGAPVVASHPPHPQCYEIPEIVPPHDCPVAMMVPNPLLFQKVD